MAQEEFEVAVGDVAYTVMLSWKDGLDVTKEIEFTYTIYDENDDEIIYSEYESTLEEARSYCENAAHYEYKNR